MIEAVGQNYLDSYFKTIKNNLSDGGKAAIQAITLDDIYLIDIKISKILFKNIFFQVDFFLIKIVLINMFLIMDLTVILYFLCRSLCKYFSYLERRI